MDEVKVLKIRNRHGSGYIKLDLYDKQDPFETISYLIETGVVKDKDVEWHVTDGIMYITRNFGGR